MRYFLSIMVVVVVVRLNKVGKELLSKKMGERKKGVGFNPVKGYPLLNQIETGS